MTNPVQIPSPRVGKNAAPRSPLPCASEFHDSSDQHGGPGYYWVVFDHPCDGNNADMTVRCKKFIDTVQSKPFVLCGACRLMFTPDEWVTVMGTVE